MAGYQNSAAEARVVQRTVAFTGRAASGNDKNKNKHLMASNQECTMKCSRQY